MRFAGTQHGRSAFRHSLDLPQLSLSVSLGPFVALVFYSTYITEFVLQKLNYKPVAHRHKFLDECLSVNAEFVLVIVEKKNNLSAFPAPRIKY